MRVKVWGTRGKWTTLEGTVDGRPVTIAILDHPGNVGFPTYWHARGYGLCGVNPFGEHDFHNDKARDGSLTIPAGSSLTFRYRVVIHAGAADRARIEQLFADFAEK